MNTDMTNAMIDLETLDTLPTAAFMPVWDWVPELIRDGSDIEQAGSLILAIGQDKKYHDKEKNMVVRFLKNRHGPKRVAGMFNIDFAHSHIPDIGAEPTNA